MTSLDRQAGSDVIIRSLIAPLQKEHLLLPLNLMAELVLVEQVLLPLSVQGVAGLILWRNLQVPLINLEALCQSEFVDKQQGTQHLRCIILRAVAGLEGVPFIALRIHGTPTPLDVGEKTLSLIEDEVPQLDLDAKALPILNAEVCAFIAARTKITNLSCVIPDLPALESAIYQLLKEENIL